MYQNLEHVGHTNTKMKKTYYLHYWNAIEIHRRTRTNASIQYAADIQISCEATARFELMCANFPTKIISSEISNTDRVNPQKNGSKAASSVFQTPFRSRLNVRTC